MVWFWKTEREKWPSRVGVAQMETHLGLPAFDPLSRELYEQMLPRGVLTPRFTPDRPPVNYWMPAHELARHAYVPGQIIIGKFAGSFLGHLDDRPMITIAGARAGKTSTVLEPNLYLYPGSMLVLDPKGELARTASLRRALGHDVYVLDPFGQSREESACFNALDELDPKSWTVVDDVASITQALIVDDGDARSKHWNDSARTLLLGIILLTLTLPKAERNLVTVRELLSLTYPRLVDAVKRAAAKGDPKDDPKDEQYYDENRLAVQTLLRAMSKGGDRFGGILAAVGNRFLGIPMTERGSIFSTAAAQTDFLDSLPLRKISMRSDFGLGDLRGERPTTIYLCLPVGRMESHYRWLRLIVQMACTVLEKRGTYPRDRAPILFMMEEFATLGHMEIMEHAAAYFPGFGIKLWAVLQDITQLTRYYHSGWETFLGNAGLVQCFANGDQSTLSYISQRLEHLMEPFELRTAFARQRYTQLLMMEGDPPAAAVRLGHQDVDAIRASLVQWAAARRPQALKALPRV
ncbi:MAG TPA: type IV secretory system conjugative DNA transfer family protein [Xanthobacteraceae bacterium]